MFPEFPLEELQGIDFDSALKADTYYLNNVKSTEGLRERLIIAYDNLVRCQYSFESISQKSNCDVLCFRSLERDDYRSFFHDVVSVMDGYSTVVLEDYRNPSKRINLKVSNYLSKNRHLLSLINEGNYLRKACLYLNLCAYLLVLNAVKDIDFKILVVFADMQPVDNILVQYFKLRGRTTVTLQHGLYVDYADFDTVNTVNYEQQTAEHFLAWGECTGQLIKKYQDSTKVKICGKPQIFFASNNFEPSKNAADYVYVILDQNIFQNENMELLSIGCKFSKEFGLKVVVKFHPQNERDLYYDAYSGISEEGGMEGAKLVLGHTSSLLFEALVQGLRVYKYDTAAPSLPVSETMKFKNVGELLEIYSKNNVEENCGDFYISCLGDESRERYKEFFKDIIGNADNL